MKINLDPNEFVDFIVLFLLERLSKDEENEIIEYSENAKDLFDKLDKKGMKSYLMKYFFDTDAKMRRKYKFIKDFFNEDISHKHELRLIQSDDISEEDINRNKKIIERAIQIATGKEDLDQEKLERLQEKVLNEFSENDDSSEFNDIL